MFRAAHRQRHANPGAGSPFGVLGVGLDEIVAYGVHDGRQMADVLAAMRAQGRRHSSQDIEMPFRADMKAIADKRRRRCSMSPVGRFKTSPYRSNPVTSAILSGYRSVFLMLIG